MPTSTNTTTITNESSERITNFEIQINKEAHKFNAAHFVAFPGFRERLHGHNYQVSLKLLGSRHICHDGYVLDFGEAKQTLRKICKELNEHFLCPTLSDVLQITVEENNKERKEGNTNNKDGTVKIITEDGSEFSIPRADCVMLPIVHSTAEELAIYMWGRILTDLNSDHLRKRGMHTLEVTVSEAPGQSGLFRMEIPESCDIAEKCNVLSYIKTGNLFPKPCPSEPSNGSSPAVKDSNTLKSSQQHECDPDCGQGMKKQVQDLIDTMNSGKLEKDDINTLKAAVDKL